jgi:hypothetical protein
VGLVRDQSILGHCSCLLPSSDRYIDDAEFRAIRAKAAPWLQIAMDLVYLTGLRRSDLLKEDVSPDGVAVRQLKTKQRQLFPMMREIKAIRSVVPYSSARLVCSALHHATSGTRTGRDRIDPSRSVRLVIAEPYFRILLWDAPAAPRSRSLTPQSLSRPKAVEVRAGPAAVYLPEALDLRWHEVGGVRAKRLAGESTAHGIGQQGRLPGLGHPGQGGRLKPVSTS